MPDQHPISHMNRDRAKFSAETAPSYRWTNCLGDRDNPPPALASAPLVAGIIEGEGIGQEVIGAALDVLQAVAESSGLALDLRRGGSIGREAEQKGGVALPEGVIDFCGTVFADGGAILCGPGGGRFVYDLRKTFDLYFKISPLRVALGLPDVAKIREGSLSGVDVLITRENTGGLYQGDWGERLETDGAPGSGAAPVEAFQRFSYHVDQVRRFLLPAARLASSRSGRLTVVWKESGVPSISRLWQRVAAEIAEAEGIQFSMIDVDLMAYRLIQDAAEFDVVATPNLFGDIMADLGAVLVGSRGLTFSGNYGEDGKAVYQTNHGAAYDLAGTGQANPAGQILSLAMMLRESYGLWREADGIESAIRSVWKDGWRTPDVAVAGCRLARTRQMGQMIAERVVRSLDTRAGHAPASS